MDTTSQERTACRLGTGGGPSFMVPLGLWDSSISKSYGSYGNFHGFFFVILFLGACHQVILLTGNTYRTRLSFICFELHDFICKLGHGR